MNRQLKDYALMIGLAIIVSIGMLGLGIGIRQSMAPDPINPIPVSPMSTSGQSVLVDVDWLANRMEHPQDLVVIDLSDEGVYQHGHIPGAVHVFWQDAMNLNGMNYGESDDLSNPSEWTLRVPARQQDRIVVYDNNASERAARLVWQLRTSGYQRSSVLDGGLAAWLGAGQGASTTVSVAKNVPSPSAAYQGNDEMTLPDLSLTIGDANVVKLDVRSLAEKQDTANGTIRTGQIPEAVSLDDDAVMQPDGTFRTPDEIRAIMGGLGIGDEATIVVYGTYGIDTGRMWLALEIAGYQHVRVFDDGYVAWANDPDVPVEVPQAPHAPPVGVATPQASPSPVASPSPAGSPSPVSLPG